MKHTELQQAIDEIINGRTLTLDERIEAVTGLDSDGAHGADGQIAIFSSLIDMVKSEYKDQSQDINLLYLYGFLAEAYDDMYDYRPMKGIADEVSMLLREGAVSNEDLRQVVPRLADAISHSVYSHALFEILLIYTKRILSDNPEATTIKRTARTLFALKELLEPEEWMEKEWTPEFAASIARLFPGEELSRIIAHPRVGHLDRDPVEYTRLWEKIYYDVEEELDRRFKDIPRRMGLCFRIWSEKKDILKEKYGIDWRTPGQMNPRVIFD